MKKFILSLAFLLSYSGTLLHAAAAEKKPAIKEVSSKSSSKLTKKEAIETLLKETILNEQFMSSIQNSIFDGMMGDQYEQLIQDPKFKEIINEMDAMLKVQIKDSLVKLYDKNFTQEEINVLIEWNRSPIIQKSMKLAPELGEEIGQAMQAVISQSTKKIQEWSSKELQQPTDDSEEN